MKNRVLIFSIVALFLTGNMACSDFLDTQPTDRISSEVAVRDVPSLRAILEQTYKNLINYNSDYAYAGLAGYQSFIDLRGQDLIGYNNATWWNIWIIYEYRNTVTDAASDAINMWRYFYNIIRQTNIVLANIDAAVGGEAAQNERNYIKGESLALRAYSYFFMAQLYQQTYVGNENLKNVILHTKPLIDPTGPDAQGARASTKEIYDLVRADLNTAIGLLPVASGTLGNRVSYRINKNIAQAMLAKVSLVTNEWSVAESMARAARGGYALMEAEDYLKGFGLNPLTNDDKNPEWIWYLPQTTRTSTSTGARHPSTWANMNWSGVRTPTDMIYVSFDLMDLYESEDVRFAQFWPRTDRENIRTGGYLWTSNKFADFYAGNFVYAGTQKINPNYTGTHPDADAIYRAYSGHVADRTYNGQINLFRAADMWLIEAEALARQGKDAEATALLNELRIKRNASEVAVTGSDLVEEILKERRRELYGEGSYLFDMLRTKKGLKRGPDHPGQLDRPAGDYIFLFQIPSTEFIYNAALSITNDQNPFEGTTIPSNMVKN